MSHRRRCVVCSHARTIVLNGRGETVVGDSTVPPQHAAKRLIKYLASCLSVPTAHLSSAGRGQHLPVPRCPNPGPVPRPFTSHLHTHTRITVVHRQERPLAGARLSLLHTPGLAWLSRSFSYLIFPWPPSFQSPPLLPHTLNPPAERDKNLPNHIGPDDRRHRREYDRA